MESQNASCDVLRREIIAQSKNEAEGILEQANKERDQLILQSQKEADEIHRNALKRAEDEAHFIQKKILSSVHLEVKKQQLRIREGIIIQMMDQIGKKLNDFRKDPDYSEFLKDSIVEAAAALKTDQVQLKVGNIEKEKLKQGLLKEAEHRIQKGINRNIKLTIMKETLNDGGVLAVSIDGRTRYDNSFSAQVKRHEEEIRLTIVQDVLS